MVTSEGVFVPTLRKFLRLVKIRDYVLHGNLLISHGHSLEFVGEAVCKHQCE